MSANEHDGLLTEPLTVAGAVNRRLRYAREEEGLSQEAWREALLSTEYRVTKSSVSKYEQWMRRAARGGRGPRKNPTLPPFDYLVRVSEVFGYRLEWLAYGTGEPKQVQPDHPTEPEADQVLERHLFGDLVAPVRSIGWAVGSTRLSVLRLLSEVGREVERSADADQKEATLRRVAAYLDAIVPSGHVDLATLSELTPREREHLVAHVRGLLYLLFRPYRAADLSFQRSKTLTAPSIPPAGASTESEPTRPGAVSEDGEPLSNTAHSQAQSSVDSPECVQPRSDALGDAQRVHGGTQPDSQEASHA